MNSNREKASDIYNIANAIYKKEIKLVDGKNRAHDKWGMNRSSFADCYYAFKKMMDGELHQRTIISEIRDCMLFHIKQDYGLSRLEKALYAFMQHINYYEKKQKTNVRKDRALYEKYMNELEVFNIEEQEELIQIVQNEDRDRIIQELKKLKADTPRYITVQSKKYLRDNKTVVQLKIIRDFKCQICNIRIPMADGSFYIEAAHITAKKDMGPELPNNLLILCPNHHKEFDLGKRHIIERDDDHIHFRLNDNDYDIPLNLE